ncbi:hypothetical protein [Lysobacter sp. F6437]|uniref:hypothetical protein n=1 Tax=Lysobacter sp. F6437 TaxID=3459296 RepID=UPI00403DF51A
MNWKIIFRFALALLFAGTAVGFVESSLSSQDGSTGITLLLGSYMTQLSGYAGILAFLSYRQANRPFAHAALAVALAVVLAALALAAVHVYSQALPSRGTYIATFIEWLVTVVALAVGVPAGRLLAKRRPSAAGYEA